MVLLRAKDVKLELLRIGYPKLASNNDKYCPIDYDTTQNNKSLVIQTPMCEIPYGVDENDDGSRSIRLNLRRDDAIMQRFVQCIESINDEVLEYALSNAYELFNKSNAEVKDMFIRDIIQGEQADMMTCVFKKGTSRVFDPSDSESDSESVSESVRKHHAESTVFFNKFDFEDSDAMRGAFVRCKIQLCSLWITDVSFGCTWEIEVIQIFPPPNERDDFFLDE